MGHARFLVVLGAILASGVLEADVQAPGYKAGFSVDPGTDEPVFCTELLECGQEVLPCNQGDEELATKCFPKAYLVPGNFQVECGWDIFLTVSYLYWNVGEDGLEIAVSAALLPNGKVVPTDSGEIFVQGTHSASGFKVGGGFDINCDGSALFLEYTRFCTSNRVCRCQPNSCIADGVWYIANWFYQPTATFQQGVAASDVCSCWYVEINWLDAVLTRVSYMGRRLLFTPYAGLRFAWIRQRLNVSVTALNAVADDPLVSENCSRSWEVGPRVGFDVSWLFGCGVKFFGDFAADLLYAKYSVQHHEDAILTADGFFFPLTLSSCNLYAVRPELQTQLGIGWGRYFYCNRMHFNISAAWDVNFLFNENVMRNLIDSAAIGTNAALGDLYTQGLTLTARWDF